MQMNNPIAVDIYDNEKLIAHYDSQQEFVGDYKKMISEINFLRERENKLQTIENIANKDNFCISELIAEIRCK